jgi:ribosomal protection tetracycline resistance protein
MEALRAAGTQVYEPIQQFRLDAPADALGALVPTLAKLRAVPQPPTLRGALCVIEGEIPAGRVHELRQELSSLTRGEGVLESTFDSYQPVCGAAPSRSRSDHNPLNRREYLLHVLRRV